MSNIYMKTHISIDLNRTYGIKEMSAQHFEYLFSPNLFPIIKWCNYLLNSINTSLFHRISGMKPDSYINRTLIVGLVI